MGHLGSTCFLTFEGRPVSRMNGNAQAPSMVNMQVLPHPTSHVVGSAPLIRQLELNVFQGQLILLNLLQMLARCIHKLFLLLTHMLMAHLTLLAPPAAATHVERSSSTTSLLGCGSLVRKLRELQELNHCAGTVSFVRFRENQCNLETGEEMGKLQEKKG